MVLPVPLGGKSTKELRFPPALTTPRISLPMLGLEIVSMEMPIPELFVPEKLTLSVPLFGKAEVSALMKSNLYDMSTSMAVGKDFDRASSYSAKIDMKGTSPFDVLSFNIDGIVFCCHIILIFQRHNTRVMPLFIKLCFLVCFM